MPAMCVCKLPDAISFETGAAMMLKGLTAQYLLRRTLPQGGLQAGDFVLFHAAAGGVGLIACQWAKALGLQLIGPPQGDAALLRVAAAYEPLAADWLQRLPPVLAEPASDRGRQPPVC